MTAEVVNPTSLLSARMLAGWCMLNEYCEAHTIPLMRSKDKKEIVCVVCHASRESAIPPPVNVIQPTAKLEPSSPVKVINASGDDLDDDEYEDNWVPPTAEEMVEIMKRRQESDAASKRMGEKLLSGWTMLQQCCFEDGYPLMSNKQKEVCVPRTCTLHSHTRLSPLHLTSYCIHI